MSDSAPRGPDEIPFLPGGRGIGPSLQILRDRMSFLKMFAQGAPLARVQVFDRKLVVVTGATEVQQLLLDNQAHLVKADVQRFSTYPLLGEGLLNSSGDLWRSERRCMASLFTPAQIAVYGTSMLACIQRETATWRDGETMDIAHAMTRLTMSIAGKTLFDADTFSESDAIGAALARAIRSFGDQLDSPSVAVYYNIRNLLLRLSSSLPAPLADPCRRAADRLQEPLLLFGRESREIRQALAVLDRYVADLIAKRRATPRSEAPQDLLTRLLFAQDQDPRRTDKLVRDEMLNLFVAGHETTAVALAWSLYLLARHPEIYRRAQAEADALPEGPEIPRVTDLPQLGLLSRVFKETLRIYPPLPVYTRATTADIVLGGYRVPRDTMLLLAPFGTHRRSELWQDPERFDPDRFLPEAEAARPRYAYIPFSAGPRICIGNHFALMEAPLVLASILRSFDLTLQDRTVVEMAVDTALRPRGGVTMRVTRRRREGQARA